MRLEKGQYALQYRDGYTSLTDERQVDRTLGSPFGSFMISGSDLPVTLSFGEPRDLGDHVITVMKTSIPVDRLTLLPNAGGRAGRLGLYISLFDAGGRLVYFVHLVRDAVLAGTSPSRMFHESTELYLSKGAPYRVSVAVRDQNRESVGVAQQIVEFESTGRLYGNGQR